MCQGRAGLTDEQQDCLAISAVSISLVTSLSTRTMDPALLLVSRVNLASDWFTQRLHLLNSDSSDRPSRRPLQIMLYYGVVVLGNN